MGSSGMKRKGRKHLPKVGTPSERAYAVKHERADVAGNFGIHGKGWVFWTALIMIFALGIAGIVTLALL
jgi:cytochrome b subunit of formate dehydrogenase